MGTKGLKREPHHQTYNQMRYRTGRFWQGPINLQQNASQMRRDYIRMTAHLLSIHGTPGLPVAEALTEQIYAKHNLDIKA